MKKSTTTETVSLTLTREQIELAYEAVASLVATVTCAPDIEVATLRRAMKKELPNHHALMEFRPEQRERMEAEWADAEKALAILEVIDAATNPRRRRRAA